MRIVDGHICLARSAIKPHFEVHIPEDGITELYFNLLGISVWLMLVR